MGYTRSLRAASRLVGEPYEVGQPEIDAARRRVFVGSSDRGLYAVRAEDGTVLWRFETLGFVQCAPLYDPHEDVVYFGSSDGALYKVNATTGSLHWRLMTNAEIARQPLLGGGLLVVANANDTVLAVAPKTGKIRWSQHRTPAMGMEVAGHAGVALWQGVVYSAFSTGLVTAFDLNTGEERWEPVDLSSEAEQSHGQLPQYLDVDTTPVVNELPTGAVIYVGSYEGGVRALATESGSTVWSNPQVAGVTDVMLWRQPAHAPREDGEAPVAAKSVLVVSSGTTGLWGLDPNTGEELWRAELPRGGVSAPVPLAGALLIAASQLGLFLVSPLDGSVIDGLHVEDGISMTPAAHGRRAFVMTNGGALLGLVVAAPN